MFGRSNRENDRENAIVKAMADIKNDISNLEQKMYLMRDDYALIHGAIYTDPDALTKTVASLQNQIAVLDIDRKDQNDQISKTNDDVISLKEISLETSINLKVVAESLKEQQESRKNFYYALVVPVTIAIIPSLFMFFNSGKPSEKYTQDLELIRMQIDRLQPAGITK